MKCLILAAGYATRLYPLTENFPKPLLAVGDKAILDWLIDDIGDAAEQYIVISNHKFAHHFERWAAERPEDIVILDDGTESNESRLGAVRDVQFAIDALDLHEDLLVLAGDNLLDFSLRSFIRYAQEKQTTCIMRYREENEARLHRSGVVEVDDRDRVVGMEEKPAAPRSHWCSPAFYYYRAADLPLVKVGIESGCGTDAPGSFVAWLAEKTVVHAFEMPGQRYDIGNLESYRLVRDEYRGIRE